MAQLKSVLAVLFLFVCLACTTDNEQTLDSPLVKESHKVKQPVSAETNLADASYYFLTGEYLFLKGLKPQARTLYQLAFNLDPNAMLGSKLIAAEMELKETDEALEAAKKMVLLYPKSPVLHMLYGNLLAQKNLFAQALEETYEALKYQPNYEAAYAQLVALYRQTGETEKALHYAVEMTQKLPSQPLGWSLVSRFYVEKGQVEKALIPSERAYSLQSSSQELLLIYAYILELNNKTSQSVQLFEKFFQSSPTTVELISQMVLLYRLFGSLEKALDRLEQMSESPSADLPSIHLQRVFILWELQKNQEALTLLQQLHEKFPHIAQVQFYLGLAQMRMDKNPEALATFDKVIEDSAFFLPAKLQMITIYAQQKESQKAIELAQSLLTSPRSTWEVYIVLANLYVESETYASAISTLQEGITKFPTKTKLLFLRGVVEEKQGDQDKCIETMKEVIRTDPEYAQAYNYLGYLYSERDENLDDAETLILRALLLKPNDGYFMDSLGWVYFKKGDLVNALKWLQAAILLVPDEAVIYEHLGDVYAFKKDMANAKMYWEKCLKSSISSPDRERVEQKLKDLSDDTSS